MPKKVTLGEEKILDNWSVLIENAHGRSKKIFDLTKESMKKERLPDVEVEEVKVKSRPRGLLGKVFERDYLMVTNKGLKDFKMYIGARDFGNNLNVSWYLTCEPGPLKKMFSQAFTRATGSLASGIALSFMMDVFEYEDLNAYVTSVHHALLGAVDTVMREVGQDPSKIDRKSRGFLGVS